MTVDERGLDTHVDLVVEERRSTDEPHDHLELASGRREAGRELLEPAIVHVRKRDARAERDRREDRHLRRRVGAGDVLRRIGLGEPEPLRLGEGVRVRRPTLHLREDEVRRPVHDPEDAVHVRRDERLPQRLDHGNRAAHAGLEPQLDTRSRRGGEELRAALRDQLLVGGHDRLTRTEQLEDVRSGRLEPAHHLGDDADRRVVAHGCELGRQDVGSRVEAALECRVADERAHDAQPVPGRALDVVRVLDEQPVDRGADRPVAEKADADLGASQP